MQRRLSLARSLWRRNVLTFGMVLCLILLGSAGFEPQRVGAASCAGGGHCYGKIRWTGGTAGAFAVMHVSTLSYDYTPGTGDIMTTEEWLLDGQTGGCLSNPYGVCWVEGGMIAISGAASGGAQFFMEYAPPNGAGGYVREDVLTPAPVTNVNLDVNITLQEGNGTGEWVIGVYAAGLNYNQQQTLPFQMSPNLVDIGQELTGNGGHAGQANWTQSQWRETNGTWHLQGNDGALFTSNPPSGNWITPPSSQPGGNFYAVTSP